MKQRPYVYIIQNKDKSHWYVGMRSANECPANEDTEYWGSSDYLDELIAQTGKENWTKTIIKEFDTKHDANEFEQLTISLMWDLPGRVNKAVNGYIDMDAPEVKAKHKAGIAKALANPEVKAKLKAALTIANKKKAKPFIATSIATGEEYFCESGYCDQARALEFKASAVSNCLNGNRPQHKGFTFRYV